MGGDAFDELDDIRIQLGGSTGNIYSLKAIPLRVGDDSVRRLEVHVLLSPRPCAQMAMTTHLVAEKPYIDLKDRRLPSFQTEAMPEKGLAERLWCTFGRADFLQSIVSIHGS